MRVTKTRPKNISEKIYCGDRLSFLHPQRPPWIIHEKIGISWYHRNSLLHPLQREGKSNVSLGFGSRSAHAIKKLARQAPKRKASVLKRKIGVMVSTIIIE
jgi:hypothetical protein